MIFRRDLAAGSFPEEVKSLYQSKKTTTPVCCTGAQISYKNGRRQLRRTSNGLGFFLFCCTMTQLTTTHLFTLFLQVIGYEGSLVYAGYAYLHPVLYYLLVGASFTISFFVPGLLYLLAVKMPLGRVLPCKKVQPSLGIALFIMGSALALMSNLPANWLNDFFQSLLPSVESSGSSGGIGINYAEPSVIATILYLIRTTILPAFFEEFVFRGILLGQLRRFGDGMAIVISSLLFGLFHSNLQQIPFAFLVGLVMGFILVRTNNIWITISIHFFNNAFACFTEIIQDHISPSAYNITYSVIFYGMFVLGALAALFLLWKHPKIFLPRATPEHNPLPLGSRIFAWISAPGTWLILLLCIAETIFPWI